MNDGVGRSAESHRSRQDLVSRAEPGRDHAHVKCRRAGIDGRDLFRSDPFVPGEVRLESCHAWPSSQPARSQHVFDLVQLLVVDIGSAENDKGLLLIVCHAFDRC